MLYERLFISEFLYRGLLIADFFTNFAVSKKNNNKK